MLNEKVTELLNTRIKIRIVAGERFIRLSFFENVSAGMCWRMRRLRNRT